MADSYVIVTLSSADAGSGPNYDVFYSTDCIAYSAATPSTVSLPTVGSQATVMVPDNSQCIKLSNINSNCINSVSQSINITTTTTTTSTTTTTTTAAPTTTTTLAPTTTTTTTAAPPVDCRINTTINVTDTGWIRWTLCDGTSVDTFLSSLGTYTITSCIQFNSIRSAFPLADLASWNNVVWGTPCNGTTTTTTAGPTTTTTTDSCPYTIYTHGAARGTCSDYCTTNYLIQTATCATGNYNTLTIGDYIYGITGPGYVAYSNTSTDTNTGPFKIAEIDASGQILSIEICNAGSCVPL